MDEIAKRYTRWLRWRLSFSSWTFLEELSTSASSRADHSNVLRWHSPFASVDSLINTRKKFFFLAFCNAVNSFMNVSPFSYCKLMLVCCLTSCSGIIRLNIRCGVLPRLEIIDSDACSCWCIFFLRRSIYFAFFKAKKYNEKWRNEQKLHRSWKQNQNWPWVCRK